MSDDRFLGENVSPHPRQAGSDCNKSDLCCLCDQELETARSVSQVFETDPTGTPYRAHARCAHEYAIAIAAFRGAASRVTP